MKRKITLLTLVLVIVMVTTSLLIACNDASDGKYYLYDNGVKFDDSWIEIKGNKWTSSAGLSGKVTVKGEQITLSSDEGDLSGTIKDGILTIGEAPLMMTYVKEGVDPTQVGNSNVDNKAKVVAIQGGTVDGLNVNLDVANTVQDVDLSGMLTVSNNSSWQLYRDKLGQTIVPTNYATNLVEGDNIYYIVVNSEDGTVNRTYTLNVNKQYYTNVYLKVNDQVIKTIENVLSHTNVELNAPSEITGYSLTWASGTYYITERNKTIEPSGVTPKNYTVTLDANGGAINGSATKTVSYNSEYNLPVATKDNYTFIGWEVSGSLVTDADGISLGKFQFDTNLTYTAKYRPNKVTLTVVSQHLNLGSVDKVTGEKDYGSTITIKANPYEKVYFDGWYTSSQEGATKISDQATFTFTVGEHGTTFVARFYCYTLTTQAFDDNAGTFEEYRSQKMLTGEQKTLSATVNPGYIWLGWFDGTTKVSDSLTYLFTMDEESKTFTARWEKCTSHTLINCVCTKCNVASHTGDIVGGQCDDCGEVVYTRDGSYVYFGSYPQMRVTDSTTVNALTNDAGIMPTESYSGRWTSYGYYEEGSVKDYMWYIDVEYNGEKYRGVYFTSYRAIYTNAKVNEERSNTFQDDAGYYTNTVYWFKYDAIKWRILSEDNGKAVLLSELILDSQEFYNTDAQRNENGSTIYANNWEYSNVRKWLNDNFYNVAFNELQKALIVATEVDVKTTAEGGLTNPYAPSQNDTTDNVYLLSYQEIVNSEIKNDLLCKFTTDYSKIQGVDAYYSSPVASSKGQGYWWLRSPDDGYNYNAACIHRIGAYSSLSVYCTYVGIVPMITIQL